MSAAYAGRVEAAAAPQHAILCDNLVKIYKTADLEVVALQGLDLGPACAQCGGMMQRTGSCYTCSSCGNNTGCG